MKKTNYTEKREGRGVRAACKAIGIQPGHNDIELDDGVQHIL
jgi:hypothetical protein